MKIICPLVFIMFLVACGFHLHGIQNKPSWIQTAIIVNQNADNNMPGIIEKTLQRYGIDIINTSMQGANYIKIVLLNDNLQQNLNNISSGTTSRQYQLIYNLYFQIQYRGRILINNGITSGTRQLTINSNRILGSNYEREQLKIAMQKDAAQQIVTRLFALNPT